MYFLDSNLGDETKKDQSLRDLAKWPGDARSAWKRLSSEDRMRVTMQMSANYGSDFAKKFLKETEKVRPKELVDQYFGRGAGPTAEALQGRGYRLAQRDSIHQWWVHPSGHHVTRNYTAAGKSRSQACRELDASAEQICKEHERLCNIARAGTDDKAWDTCLRVRASCVQAEQNAKNCN